MFRSSLLKSISLTICNMLYINAFTRPTRFYSLTAHFDAARVLAMTTLRREMSIGKPKGYFNSKYLPYKLDTHCLSGLPDTSKPFLVLGIETSCDDTGVSVVRSDGRVLSNVVFSQHSLHSKFGGIVPNLALEAHIQTIDSAIEQAISKAGIGGLEAIDVIAATRGPGLEVCLRVGYKKAQVIESELRSFNFNSSQ